MTADERCPFSYPILLLISVTIRPTPYRRFLFLPIFVTAHYLVYHTIMDDIFSRLAIGASIPPLVASALDYILLTELQMELFQTSQTIPQAAFPGLKWRLKWSLSLLTSQRGTGWTHEPRNLPPSPYTTSTPRRRFVVDRIAQSVLLFMVWGAAATYNEYRSAMFFNALEETRFLGKCALLWIWTVPTILPLTIIHALWSAAMIAFGIWGVEMVGRVYCAPLLEGVRRKLGSDCRNLF